MGLLTPLAIRIGAISWMPKLLPQVVWLDRTLHRVSGGRVTVLDIAGLPGLNLTVTGKKSGIERTTPLLCVPDGDSFLIAGSYFGGPKTPLWVGNLRATEGRATAEYGKRTFPVTATELSGDRARRGLADDARDLAQLREVRGADRPADPGLPAHPRFLIATASGTGGAHP